MKTDKSKRTVTFSAFHNRLCRDNEINVDKLTDGSVSLCMEDGSHYSYINMSEAECLEFIETFRSFIGKVSARFVTGGYSSCLRCNTKLSYYTSNGRPLKPKNK